MSSERIKLSHKDWRKQLKKTQRKRRRQEAARILEEKIAASKADWLGSTAYQSWLADQEALSLVKEDEIRQQNEIENEKWLQSERLQEERWLEQRKKLEGIERVKEEARQKIKEEFEAEQKRLTDLKAEKERIEVENKRLLEELQEKIDDYIAGHGDVPIELTDNADSNPGKPDCPFFTKIGSCRFGSNCIRNHSRPKISRILLVPSFFSHINLDQGKTTEYGADSSLEYDDRELYKAFTEFFGDALPEFQKFGPLERFHVSQNYEPHMRGNAYVEYKSQRDSLNAYRHLQGRYYAGRMINVEFRQISWKTAVCGLSFRNICSKGRNCHFLHVFKNPRNQFSLNRVIFDGRESRRGTSSARQASTRNDLNWNDDKQQSSSARNWRWSESPENRTRGDVDDDIGTRESSQAKSRRSKDEERVSKRKESKRRSKSKSPRRKQRRRHSRSSSSERSHRRTKRRKAKSQK